MHSLWQSRSTRVSVMEASRNRNVGSIVCDISPTMSFFSSPKFSRLEEGENVYPSPMTTFSFLKLNAPRQFSGLHQCARPWLLPQGCDPAACHGHLALSRRTLPVFARVVMMRKHLPARTVSQSLMCLPPKKASVIFGYINRSVQI